MISGVQRPVISGEDFRRASPGQTERFEQLYPGVQVERMFKMSKIRGQKPDTITGTSPAGFLEPIPRGCFRRAPTRPTIADIHRRPHGLSALAHIDPSDGTSPKGKINFEVPKTSPTRGRLAAHGSFFNRDKPDTVARPTEPRRTRADIRGRDSAVRPLGTPGTDDRLADRRRGFVVRGPDPASAAPPAER